MWDKFTRKSVRLTSSLAPIGPLDRRICLRYRGSMGGASNSGIPADNLSRSWSIDLVMHAFMSGSLFLHGFMYDAARLFNCWLIIRSLIVGWKGNWKWKKGEWKEERRERWIWRKKKGGGSRMNGELKRL